MNCISTKSLPEIYEFTQEKANTYQHLNINLKNRYNKGHNIFDPITKPDFKKMKNTIISSSSSSQESESDNSFSESEIMSHDKIENNLPNIFIKKERRNDEYKILILKKIRKPNKMTNMFLE